LEAADSPTCSKVRVIFAIAHISVEFEDNFPENQAFFFLHTEGIMVKDT
jgi:hypothetical protein